MKTIAGVHCILIAYGRMRELVVSCGRAVVGVSISISLVLNVGGIRASVAIVT